MAFSTGESGKQSLSKRGRLRANCKRHFTLFRLADALASGDTSTNIDLTTRTGASAAGWSSAGEEELACLAARPLRSDSATKHSVLNIGWAHATQKVGHIVAGSAERVSGSGDEGLWGAGRHRGAGVSICGDDG